jgi:choline dehydrogenase-like flavoprotein
MIQGAESLERGFVVGADAVVVGSGPGGAVAAANLSAAGMRVVVVESGPEVRPDDMTRDAPIFLARYFWEGGLRMVGGTGQFPSLQARCVGGGSIVNSAIMYELPGWVRRAWSRETGLELFTSEQLDRAYRRVFSRLRVAPTPLAVMGRRNLLIRNALDEAGIENGPLPRAVVDCEGCGDCLIGCASGHKQSMDKTYLADAVSRGAEVFPCSNVERILMRGGRAVGVTGYVTDARGRRRLAPFRVNAPRVVLAAGTAHTPVILLRSGIDANRRVGATFFAHIGGGMVGVMDEVVEPWIGATQGWGAMSKEFPGMKYECLWAPPSVLMVRWGDVGIPFLERLGEVRHATILAMVYRGRVHGRVTAKRDGSPRIRFYVPDDQCHIVNAGLRIGARALLSIGARYVHTGVPGAVEQMRKPEDTDSLLGKHHRARNLQNTLTHVFGSCRMSARADEGPVDAQGRVRTVEGVYITDGSLFPSPSAVNPQATIMALSDIISRGIGGLRA